MAKYYNSYPPPSTAASSKQFHPQQESQQSDSGTAMVINYDEYNGYKLQVEAPGTPVAVHLYQPGPQRYGGVSAATTHENRDVPEINILPRKPNNYRSYSIFVLICSCCLCGLVALFYSCKVDRAYKRGDIVTARKASDRARKWNFAGVVCGVMDFVVMAAIWLAISYGVWRVQQ